MLSKISVAHPTQPFEVTARDLKVYRGFVGRTYLSLAEDKPKFESCRIYGQAVADHDNRVCVLDTNNSSEKSFVQTFDLTITSDENITTAWDTSKRTGLLLDNLTDPLDTLTDPERRRIWDLQHEIFDRLPPTATLFKNRNWSLECEIPPTVLEQLSADVTQERVESVTIKISWPYALIDNVSGAWGYFGEAGNSLKGHVSTFHWLLTGPQRTSANPPQA